MSIPNVSNVLNGYMKKYAVVTYTRSIVNHRSVETPTTKYLMLHLQPTPQEIVMRKPEEQRHWKFWTIWSKTAIELNIDDRFEISGIGYRLKSKSNWKEGGFYSYEAIEDYTQEETGTA